VKEVTTQAVVLRTGHFREIDIWLKLLLPERGIETVFAFGGSRSRHRFPGCLDVLNTLECRLRTSGYGNYVTLEEARLISGPGDLRSNWSRMGLAANCLRFLEALDVPADSAREAFGLVEDLRRHLAESRTVSPLFPLFFRFAMACRLGYGPDLEHCSLCGRRLGDEPSFFQVSEGLMLCTGCAGKFPSSLLVKSAVRNLLCSVEYGAPETWGEARGYEERRACSALIDGFIQYHLGIVWDRGTFRKS